MLVFSQWRRMLDLIQSALQARHIRFSRLDGTMGVSARARAIAQFTVRLRHIPPRKTLLPSLRSITYIQGHAGLGMLTAVQNLK